MESILGAGLYSCDVIGDITVAGRILKSCGKLQNRKTAVCNCSFCESKNWNFTTGISGVAVLVDQHIAKNCVIHVQFHCFKKIPQREYTI